MQPNDPYQQTPSGIDYLNEISAPPPPTGFDKKTKLILIICGVIGVLSLAFIFFQAANRSNSGPSPLGLAARLHKLHDLSSTYGSKLRSTPLQDANSSLTAILTTANQSIAAPLQAQGIDISSSRQQTEIAALDPSDELKEEFDEAFLNANLDTVYGREMKFQIEDTLVMMERMLETTRSESMKEFLETTIPNIESLQRRFESATTV